MKINSKETLIIAAGPTAQKIIDILYSNDPEINYLYLGTDKLVINTNMSKTIWFGNLKYQQSEYDFEEYKKILLNRTSKFNEIISDYKNIIIVSCIEEKFSSDTLFELINHFDNLKIKYTIFIIKPSEADGQTASDLSVKSLKKLEELNYSKGKDLFVYEKENMNTISISITPVYKKAAEILTMIIESKNN